MEKNNLQFEPLSQIATIIVTDYTYLNKDAFLNDLKRGNIISRYDVVEEEIKIDGEQKPSPFVIEQLKTVLPQEFTARRNNIIFTFFPAEFKLSVVKKDFARENFPELVKITNDLLDRKVSEIGALGLNFVAEFNLQNIKLQLLNNNVESIKDFNKNSTFEFVLPLDYRDEDGSIATYRIRKSRGGGDTGEDRYYEVSVNFHFDFKELNTKAKFDKIEAILSETYYSKFLATSQEFLALNDR
jgi:hypothetical protein